MKLTYLLFLILIASFSSGASGQDHKITDGILDLRYQGLPKKAIDLKGEWEFYWEKHVLPADFKKSIDLVPDALVRVPSYWTDYSKQISGLSNTGYATYRLRILIPESSRDELEFAVPIFDSSYRLYINGKYINSNGVPGTTAETSKPDYKPFNYTFLPQNDTIEVIVNVSNFHHRRGGFWHPMKFGIKDVLQLEQRQDNIFTSLTNGMLLAFIGFFMLFFAVFRDDRTMLYFSIGSLGILVRTLFTGSLDILSFFDISWQWLIRIEYLSSFLAVIFSLWYFYYIYKDRIIPWVSTAITVILFLSSILVLTTPVSVFSYTMLFFLPIVILVLGYYMIRSIIAAVKQRGYYSIITIGFGVLLLGVVNDIFAANGNRLFSSEYMIPHALILFILIQVIILIYRWVGSSKGEKRLRKEIEFVNKNLENIVIDRTTELTNQKGELEEQKKVTDAKNKELEKTISIKNRIFSIIAHDLKSPVLNLSLMIEHLRNNNDPEVQNSVINSISQQAGFATNLIENLLIWGEQQQNKINYHPEHVNLTDLVLENFNLLKESSDRKKIKITYSHKGNPVAICDKDLINIVLRNIISNSIKFTERMGSISVSVEEPPIKDGTIYIKIKDNGLGIAEEKLEKILQQEIVDSSVGTDDEKGTGLGLQLCNDLIRINKGSLNIESELNRGTTITIMLPSPINK